MGRHVMLAQTEELDVLYDDHLVVLHGKERAVNKCLDFHFTLTAREKPECSRDTFGVAHESLAVGIFDEPRKQTSDDGGK